MCPLEPWEIEKIEEEKRKRERDDRPQPSVEDIPPEFPDRPEEKKDDPKRGVIIIDL